MTQNGEPVAVALVAISSAGAALAGGALLYLLRRRSLTATLVETVLIALLAASLGVFVSTELTPVTSDVTALLWTAMGAAGAVTVVIAVLFGWSIMSTARTTGSSMGQMGSADRLDLLRRPSPERSKLAIERVPTDERITEPRDRQAALADSRRELVAWMSHDLRTPLAALRAMAAALEERVVVDQDTVAEYHTRIRIEADRLASMIADLFELSRMQAVSSRPTHEPQPVGELVSDAIAAIRPLAEARRISLLGSPGHPLLTRVDPMAFGRALRNLLVNAVQYSVSGGQVAVATGSAGGRVRVEVSDSCGGIPTAHLAHIFEPGFRGSATAEHRTPGAGLGLVIVKRVMAAHAGAVEVANEPPVGCRFVLTLPAEEPVE